MTRSQVADCAVSEDQVLSSKVPDPELQVTCDVDRIISGLDYDSFELLPGTVNPRPGMRFVDDTYEPFPDSVDPTDPAEESQDYVVEDTVSAPSMYFLPSPPAYWSPFLVDNRLEGKKKKKNKKKRNKNRQRQLQLQLQLEQDMSPPSTPDISDGSVDSPMHSPMKHGQVPSKVELSPEKKAKKKRNKQRRRGSGRARRSSSQTYPAYEGFDMMSVQLNLSGSGLYPKPDPYPRAQGPSFLGGTMFSRGTPLWIPHPHPVIYGQC